MGAGTKAPRHQRRLDLVILGAGRAVQVDVVDRIGGQAGTQQRLVQRAFGALALRVRGRHVVGIARFPVPQQLQGAAAGLQQRKAGRLADADAVSLRVERPACARRQQRQRVEAEQHAVAQRVHTADHRRIHQAQAHPTFSLRKHLGAG